MSELGELGEAVLGAGGGPCAVGQRDPRRAGLVRGFDEGRFLERLAASGLRWVARSDGSFPRLLKEIHDPPWGLFVRGAGCLDLLSAPAVAIVGSRSCSPYGVHVARRLGRELAAAGLVVVSGLARGADSEAHRGALEAGGVTVAVLGCGVERDYPAAHAALAARICERGLIVSEYPPGVEPAPWRFPARNRIIAGLCAATVIVEARERSGALITADFALEENRDVLAVPGEITSALSTGTNALLRQGAAPLLGPEDVLELFGIGRQDRLFPVTAGHATVVLGLLRDRSQGVDEVVRGTGLSAAEAAAALAELELIGLAVAQDGRYRAVVPPT
jgi:DNA processing protein